MGKSKLETTGRLMESECKARCVWRDCKRQRRIMSRLRGHWQLKWELRFYRQGFKNGTIYIEVQVFGGTKIEKGKIDD